MRLLVKKVTPKRSVLLDIDNLKNELSDVLDEVKEGVLVDFESTVSTWLTPVSFRGQKIITTSGIGIQVQPSGGGAEIWSYVNEGTRPHVIRPKFARSLAFRSGYRPKTRPGRIKSGSGGPSGSTLFAQQVMHPGTEARDFTRLIAEKWKPEFKRIGENAMRRVARQ